VAGWLIVTDLRAAPLPPSAVRGLAAGLLWAAILLLLAETAEHSLLAGGSVWAGWAVRTVTHMDRGTTVCVLLVWPVLIGLWRQGSPAAALFVLFVVAFACGLSHDAAAKVALLLGGAVLAATAWLTGQPAVRLLGGWLIRTIVGLLAVATVLAPLAAWRIPPPEETIHWHWLMRTAHHRLTIWRFVGESIRTAPLWGAGLEASRWLDQGRHVVLIDDAGERRDEELLPLHPHDAPLQLWLETGAVGAVLAAIVILTLGARLAAPPDHRVPAEDSPGDWRPAGIAMLVSAFFFGAVSYGLWQSWWQSTLWLSVALWCGLSPRRMSG
jgi:O-antigen ligase